LETLLRPSVAEYRIEENRQEFAGVSVPTLLYMRDRSDALEARLRWHGMNLEWVAAEEHDLYEAMRLSARLTNITGNAAQAGRRSERLRAELLRRQVPDR
jgi:hypothetical protein